MAQQPQVEGEHDWIFDCLITFLKSPRWKTPVVSYIEEHCLVFDNEEENKLEYTNIHMVSLLTDSTFLTITPPFLLYFRISSNLSMSFCASLSLKWVSLESNSRLRVNRVLAMPLTIELSNRSSLLTTLSRSRR